MSILDPGSNKDKKEYGGKNSSQISYPSRCQKNAGIQDLDLQHCQCGYNFGSGPGLDVTIKVQSYVFLFSNFYLFYPIKINEI
jgi:hypothetical protein